MEGIDVILNACLHPGECCEYNSTRYIVIHDKKLGKRYLNYFGIDVFAHLLTSHNLLVANGIGGLLRGWIYNHQRKGISSIRRCKRNYFDRAKRYSSLQTFHICYIYHWQDQRALGISTIIRTSKNYCHWMSTI